MMPWMREGWRGAPSAVLGGVAVRGGTGRTCRAFARVRFLPDGSPTTTMFTVFGSVPICIVVLKGNCCSHGLPEKGEDRETQDFSISANLKYFRVFDTFDFILCLIFDFVLVPCRTLLLTKWFPTF